MKKAIFVVAVMFLASGVYAQDFLKGPKAKNAKAGQLLGPRVSIVFDESPTIAKGPDAKNFKIWNKKSSPVSIRTRRVIDNPKGPAAKNRKVWEESKNKNIDSKASYVEPKELRKRKLWWH